MARGEGGRLVYADLLRVAATLAVVILHLSGRWPPAPGGSLTSTTA